MITWCRAGAGKWVGDWEGARPPRPSPPPLRSCSCALRMDSSGVLTVCAGSRMLLLKSPSTHSLLPEEALGEGARGGGGGGSLQQGSVWQPAVHNHGMLPSSGSHADPWHTAARPVVMTVRAPKAGPRCNPPHLSPGPTTGRTPTGGEGFKPSPQPEHTAPGDDQRVEAYRQPSLRRGAPPLALLPPLLGASSLHQLPTQTHHPPTPATRLGAGRMAQKIKEGLRDIKDSVVSKFTGPKYAGVRSLRWWWVAEPCFSFALREPQGCAGWWRVCAWR